MQPYSVYRDAGVEWLGEVPGHWDVKRLAYSVLRSDVKLEPEQAEGLPYVGLEHVASWTGRLLPLDDQLTPEGAANAFEVGDVLFGKLRPYLAKALCADFSGVCSTEFLVLKPHDYERRYLLYLLLTDGFISYVDSSTYGAKMPRASWDFIGDSLLPLPPVEEQRGIAGFLDRETARIDLLIGKKRLLIERLHEYRTALITRAVTRGLPSEAARLKPSGVEWLRDVPSHWDVAQLRRIVRLRAGDGITSDLIEEYGAFPVFGGNGIRGFTSEYTHDGEFVLIGRQGALCGNVHTAHGKFWASEHAVVATPVASDNVRWLGHLLDVMNLGQYSAAAAQPGLAVERINALSVPLPPAKEQAAIADFLDRETDKIDDLVGRTNTAIERLEEYRSALITSAVTGKIDVREPTGVGLGGIESLP